MLVGNISLSLLVAGVLLHTPRLMAFYRVLFFLPVVLPRVVVARLWQWIYHPFYGAAQTLGFSSRLLSLGDPNTVIYAIALVGVWCWWGFPLVIFVSALQQVDKSLYEAAIVEGASRIQTYFYVTLPVIRATIIFVIVLVTILSFGVFDLMWIMTWGGPGHASEVMGTLIYKEGIVKLNAGYASALATVLVLLSSAAILAYIFAQKRGWEV
jgi:raffinose/stachyose/melibiose transport system permease protein